MGGRGQGEWLAGDEEGKCIKDSATGWAGQMSNAGHGTHRLRSPPSLEGLLGPAFSLGPEDICSWEVLIVTRGPFSPQPSAMLLEILPAFGSHVTLSSYFPDPKALTLVIISTLPGGSRDPSTGNN